VVLTVLPRERSAGSPPAPLPLHVLREVAERLGELASPRVRRLEVRNPELETIRVWVNVRFRPDADPPRSTHLLQRVIDQWIAPWMYDLEQAMELGCRTLEVDKLFEAVRRQDFVEQATAIMVQHKYGQGALRSVRAGGTIVPATPWTLFVPDPAHVIASGAPDLQRRAIGTMAIGADFDVAGSAVAPDPGRRQHYFLALGNFLHNAPAAPKGSA
jgi:hypothetical protein